MLEFLGDPSTQWIWGAAQAVAIIVGFYFVVRQISLARHQNSITHMIYFRDLWQAPPILRARRDLGRIPTEANGDFLPHEDVLATFANDIGIAVRTGQVDAEHVRRFFGYYIIGYWMVLGPQVRKYRESTGFEEVFSSFEYLHDILVEMDTRRGLSPMTDVIAQRFRQEEAIQAQYYLEAISGKFK